MGFCLTCTKLDFTIYTIKCLKITDSKKYNKINKQIDKINKKRKKEKCFRLLLNLFLILSYTAIMVLLVNELWLFITINYDL